MLIRSQDKESLHILGEQSAVWCERYGENELGVYVNGLIAGKYSIMEKAKQVLTDIELELLAESKIFIMPQDDEVEVRKYE